MPDVDVSSDGTCKRDDTACIKQASDVGRSTVWNGYMHGVGACKYEILAENGPSVARQFGIGITQAAHGIIEYADVQGLAGLAISWRRSSGLLGPNQGPPYPGSQPHCASNDCLTSLNAGLPSVTLHCPSNMS